jgi:hypothetical protein
MSGVRRCDLCRAFVQEDDRFCWSCGAELVHAEPRIAGDVARRPAEEELEPEVALVLRRAHLAQQRGQLAEAERLVSLVLDKEPNTVVALSMLAGLLRAKGDLVGSVAAAQRASEAAAGRYAPPGALERAREERARAQEQALRSLGGPFGSADSPLDALRGAGAVWYRSRQLFLALAAVGAIALVLATVAVVRGELSGYLWFGVSFVSAGWCYNDAEAQRRPGILWAPLVLCLGPFGLAIYLLATH